MFINFSLFEKSNLLVSDLVFLAAIKQTETEFLLKNLIESDYNRFKELSLIKHIKVKKKDEHPYISLRLSDKGVKLINTIFSEPIAGQDEEILFEWLSNYYLERKKEIGNPNRVKKLLAWFSNETGIYKNNLIKLIVDFLKDEYVDEESRVLEFILFYPKKFTTDKGKTVAYEARPDIFDSWLYKHYQKNKERLISSFEDFAEIKI